MLDIPGLSYPHASPTAANSNGHVDPNTLARDLAILETLKRDIKAGQHPAFQPRPRVDSLRSLWKGPSAEHNDSQRNAPPAAHKPGPFSQSSSSPLRPPPAQSSVDRLPPPSRDARDAQLRPASNTQSLDRDRIYDATRVSPTVRHYDGRDPDLDRPRERLPPPPAGDRYVPHERDRRLSVNGDKERLSSSLDVRRPPPEDRHYEPARGRDYPDGYTRDNRPLPVSRGDAPPLHDRRPPIRDVRPHIDDRRYDDRRPVFEERQAPPATHDRKGPIPHDARPPPPTPSHLPSAVSQHSLPVDKRPPPPPLADDRRPVRDRPVFEERRRSASPAVHRAIYDERRSAPRATPPVQQLNDRVPSLSERLKDPSGAPVSTPRPEVVRPSSTTVPLDRRPPTEERRPAPPLPAKPVHANTLLPKVETSPPLPLVDPERYSRPRTTRPPSPPPPLSVRVRPENNYRPTENNYRPSEDKNYRPSEASTYRPPADPLPPRPVEVNSYRPPPPEVNGHNSYRPSDPHSYRPAEPNVYRPPVSDSRPPLENNYRPPPVVPSSTYRTSEPSSYRPSEVIPHRSSEPSSYRPSDSSYRPVDPVSYRPREDSAYRPPADPYDRREREYALQRSAPPLALPPRSSGGWVDDYRDRGRPLERDVRKDEVYYRGPPPPAYVPSLRKRSPSPGLVGYVDAKRARYEPEPPRYAYERPRSPLGRR